MLKVNCPVCKKIVLWTEAFPDRPFCSERCRLIDLGAWSDESYRVPAQAPQDFLDDDEV